MAPEPSGPAAPLPRVILARWEHRADAAPAASTVLPDGCRDLILHVDAGGHAQWQVSPLADCALLVPGQPHEQWLGFRLQPGTRLDEAALLRAAHGLWQARARGAAEPAVVEAIADLARIDPRVQECLAALRLCASVDAAAQSVGTSARTLERWVGQATGRSPRYWRALARVRHAARALAGDAPLAAIAADHGYADQAHFSRECLRWLGASPARLRAAPDLMAVVQASGYG